MRKRQHQYFAPAAVLLSREILGLIKKRPKLRELKESDIWDLVELGTADKQDLAGLLSQWPGQWAFRRAFYVCPDETLELLTLVRSRWFKNSKSHRIQKYIAKHGVWMAPKGCGSEFEVYDKNLADNYNAEVGSLHGDAANEGDVDAARRALAAKLESTRRFKSFLNKPRKA